jgi:hypothetical protein
MKSSNPLHRQPKGTSVQEYLLPSLLIGLVIITSVASLMGQGPTVLNRSFQGSVDTQSGTMSLRVIGKHPALTQRTFDLGNGKIITLTDFPSDMALLVESDGGNGATEKILAAIQDLITQLEKEGVIDPNTEGVLLRELANKGTRLAANQKIIEDAILQCQGKGVGCFSALNSKDKKLFDAIHDSSFFVRKGLEIDPQFKQYARSLTGPEQNALDTFIPDYLKIITRPAAFEGDKNNLMFGRDMKAFLSQLALSRDALKDKPAVSPIIEYLSGGIYFNTLNTAFSSNRVENGKVDSQQFSAFLKQENEMYLPQVKNNFANLLSTDSQQKADTICQTGQGQHEQGQCVPNG